MHKDVTDVKWIGDYRLQLTFEGGERREVDVAAMVSFEGVFEPLKDPSYFRLVTVNPEVGTIVWSNGADSCPDCLFATGKSTNQ